MDRRTDPLMDVEKDTGSRPMDQSTDGHKSHTFFCTFFASRISLSLLFKNFPFLSCQSYKEKSTKNFPKQATSIILICNLHIVMGEMASFHFAIYVLWGDTNRQRRNQCVIRINLRAYSQWGAMYAQEDGMKIDYISKKWHKYQSQTVIISRQSH